MQIRNIVVISHEPEANEDIWLLLGIGLNDVKFIDSAPTEVEAFEIKKKIEATATPEDWYRFDVNCGIVDGITPKNR